MEITLLIGAIAAITLVVFNQQYYNSVFKEMRTRHDKTEMVIRNIRHQASRQHHHANRSNNVINLNSRRNKSTHGK
jgi:pSer/pThr/pTyr-binding forkhead associated (FHA) protein